MSLKNLSIAAAATLIYEETQECTFYLDHKDLKRVVAGLGGIGTDSITGKTNLVVLGDTSRERNKKGEDKWVTSGRCKQIEKQREQHDAGQRKLPALCFISQGEGVARSRRRISRVRDRPLRLFSPPWAGGHGGPIDAAAVGCRRAHPLACAVRDARVHAAGPRLARKRA